MVIYGNVSHLRMIIFFPSYESFFFFFVTLTKSMFLPQSKEEHWEEEPGAGKQVHRRTGRADIRKHQRHGRPQREARQMCHPQRDGEADPPDQGARWGSAGIIMIITAPSSPTGPAYIINLHTHPNWWGDVSWFTVDSQHRLSPHTDVYCSPNPPNLLRLHQHLLSF